MFATSERVRPCSARCSPRSVGRLTSSCSPSCVDVDVAVDALAEFALRAVDAHLLRLDRDGHAGGDRDGLSADPRHAAHQTCASDLAADVRRRAPRGRS